MIISKSYPPNYKIIKEKFNPPENAVFTYGNTIYAPHVDFTLPRHLVVHEETHEKQQNGDPAAWWKRYIKDPMFRFSQELQAYQNQYRNFLKCNNRDKVYFFACQIARDLSGSTYGHVVDYDTALQRIRSYS